MVHPGGRESEWPPPSKSAGKGGGKGGGKGAKGKSKGSHNASTGNHTPSALEKDLGDDAEKYGPDSRAMELFKKFCPTSKRFEVPAAVPLHTALNRAEARRKTAEQKKDKLLLQARDLANSLEKVKDQMVDAQEALDQATKDALDIKLKVSEEAVITTKPPAMWEVPLQLDESGVALHASQPLLDAMRKELLAAQETPDFQKMVGLFKAYHDKVGELQSVEKAANTPVDSPSPSPAADSSAGASQQSGIESEAKKLQEQLQAKNAALDKRFLESVQVDLEARKKAKLNSMACG